MKKLEKVILLFGIILLSILFLFPKSAKAVTYYQDNIWIEDFNEFGAVFTNSSGAINVTCGIGDRPTGLQLNYTTQDIIRKNPIDGDNWTESYIATSEFEWQLSILDSIEYLDSTSKVGSWTVRFRYNYTNPSFYMLLFSPTLGVSFTNISGYDRMNFWLQNYYDPLDAIPELVLKKVFFDDIESDSISLYPNIILDDNNWHNFSLNLNDFTTNPLFNPEKIWAIQWEFEWYPSHLTNRTEPQFIMIDGLHFEKDEIETSFKSTGIWYSDWINIKGTGQTIIINTTYPENVTLLISDDNSSWNVLSSFGSTNISQYNYTEDVILRVQLGKTINNNSPIIDYIIIISRANITSINIPMLIPLPMAGDLLPLDPLIIYGIIGGLVVIVIIELVIIKRRS